MTRRTLYAYLNIENPLVAWEVAVGRVCSAGVFDTNNYGVSLWMYNILRRMVSVGATQSILNEFRLERIRQQRYPGRVSRLTGMYFFDSKYNAECAIERWNLPERYKEYITAIDFHGSSYSYYDSEWITAYMSSGAEDWYSQYIRGETLGAKPLTEILAVGYGGILNHELRKRAYFKVLEDWPTSTPLLAFCITGFNESGVVDCGLSTPFVWSEDGKVIGQHFISLATLQEKQKIIGKDYRRLTEEGILQLPAIVVPSDPDGAFSVPDSSAHKFSLESIQLSSILSSIHNS